MESGRSKLPCRADCRVQPRRRQLHITALDADAESLNAPLQPDESPTEQGDPKNGPKRRGTSGEMAKLLI
jgi:hypothetical protein